MKKTTALLLTLSMLFFMFGMTSCKKQVEVPSKRDVKEAVEDEYDKPFDLDSKDIAEDGSEAEWVFVSKDGTLIVTVTWSADDPDEFDFDKEDIGTDVVEPVPTIEPDPSVEPDPSINTQTNGFKIGVSMPTKDLQRWNQDGDSIKSQLEALGYEVDLQYAANDVATQVSQVENMINSGCDVLIIAAIESSSLGEALEDAEYLNIPVIAYDRLLMESDTIDYYVTFDNYMVGQLQGEYIESALGLDYGAGPYNIEITTGDPSDNNALFFYQGAMDVLNPYIEDGQLVVVSGQTEFNEVATASWKTENAQDRAEDIINLYYSDGTQIDAWLCSNDSTALGVENALAANYPGSYPVITGQDCDILNVQNIINDKQAMSVFKDTRTLANQVSIMADQICSGDYVEVNDTVTFNNGVKTVPTYACQPVFVDKTNYVQVLIDSGYYTTADLGI